MPRSLIGLGSNLGDRAHALVRAVDSLRAQRGIILLAESAWHRTAPIGGPPGQDEFLNAAMLIETSLGPRELHDALRRVETDLGRARGKRWAARTIDLDLLFYDSLALDTPELVVPHPRMAFRRFVLEPAAEVAPDMVHPKIGWTIADLLAHLNTAVPYVAIAGLPGVGKSRLAQALAEAEAGRFIGDPLQAGPDPSGPQLAAEIELLDRRADALDAAARAGHETLLVTDFWLDQALAYARAGLDDASRERLRHQWEQRQPKVLAPKLLVVLDPPLSAAVERAHDAGWMALLRRSLVDCANRPGIGPMLYLRSPAAAEQLNELKAAVDAMK